MFACYTCQGLVDVAGEGAVGPALVVQPRDELGGVGNYDCLNMWQHWKGDRPTFDTMAK